MTKESAARKAAKYLEWADKADSKRKAQEDSFRNTYKDFDWTEPIKVGHHSQRRHQRVFETRDSHFRSVVELEQRAKRFREKADNLNAFAQRNKGDAERKRQTLREQQDKGITVGTIVNDFAYREGEVKRVNKKTYTIRFTSGFTCTRDKTYVTILI